MTRKGFGYDPAERHEADQFHQIGPFDVETGVGTPKGRIWTDYFAEEMVALGAERQDLVAITAAMLYPVGLDRFAAAYPERTFDVGIAEQHAVTSAAGLAMGGLHPVVAIYATFLNRAFDQVLMDVALHRCGVTFVLDRAGVTGDDGASHNGMWDMSILQVVPGLRLCAPRDGARVGELLREASPSTTRPTVLRIPKGPPPAGHRGGRPGRLDGRAGARRRQGRAHRRHRLDGLRRGRGRPPAWPTRASASPSSTRAGSSRGTPLSWTWRVTIGWSSALKTTAGSVDAARPCCSCSTTSRWRLPFRQYGIPQEFLDHAKRDAILERIGLTAQSLARGIVEDVTALGRTPEDERIERRSTAVWGTESRSRLAAVLAAVVPRPPTFASASVVQGVRWQGAGAKADWTSFKRRQRSQRASWAARSGRTLVVGVLALLFGLCACGGNPDESLVGDPEPDRVTAAEARAQEQRILRQRVRAVRERDLELFLRRVDHGNEALMARQRRYFSNLVQLPLASFDYRLLDTQWEGLTRAPRWGDDVHIPQVQLTMQLEGYDAVPVERTVGFVFAFAKGRGTIVSDRTSTGKPLFLGAPAPWDLAAITVREEPGVLGIFDRGTQASADTVTEAVRKGIDQIERALPFELVRQCRRLQRAELQRACVLHRRPGWLAGATSAPSPSRRTPDNAPFPGRLDSDAGDAELGARRASRSSAGSPATS